MLADLQATLAYTASFVDFLFDETRLSPKALKHLGKAYALISERLSGPRATSNETIATVTSICLYQRLHQLRSIGMVHFQGLQKILALKGGMGKFATEDRYLALKPWGLDLEFTMRDGRPLCFTGQDSPSPCFTQPSLPVPASGSIAFSLFSDNLHPDLAHIFLEMHSFARLLNEICDNNKVDALDFTQHGQYLAYRLLTVAPLSKLRRLFIVDAEVHVALTAFVVTLLPEYNGQHQRFDLLADMVREVTASSTPKSEVNSSFRLWMLILAGIAITGSSDDEWLLPELRTRIRELGLGSWDKVKEQLQWFIWIPSLHDDAGHRLFETVEHGLADFPKE
ncbi:hypothetical protein LIA77_04783 [Sarocladium implicatum]|nr:hypothetical protein LIA77_04783 [Sarocladium implicatum]